VLLGHRPWQATRPCIRPLQLEGEAAFVERGPAGRTRARELECEVTWCEGTVRSSSFSCLAQRGMARATLAAKRYCPVRLPAACSNLLTIGPFVPIRQDSMPPAALSILTELVGHARLADA
jgi:hypothetical protein